MSNVRVRFAPSPTGRMHMGNVRAALINYLFARQHDGTFILRVEDTDAERNIEEGVAGILSDLEWCGLRPDEGPGSLNNEPYFQSKRQALYLQSLNQLIEDERVYKCFCTQERLEQMRAGQRAAGQPPRYDGRCRALPQAEEKKQTVAGTPFIWRFARHENEEIMVPTLGEPLSFEMAHFYDFAVTRADGSFTFLFTNAVDDIDMKISHVIRGSDHLSNTALQAALYAAFGYQMPVFIHLALLCGQNGKKLSKRDFGFSLSDVQADGIVPEALAHYLLTAGGTTIDDVLAHEQLIAEPLEARLQHTGHIAYDLDALRALNRNYIHAIDAVALADHLQTYEQVADKTSVEADAALVGALQKEVNNLAELRDLILRISTEPKRQSDELVAHAGSEESAVAALDAALEVFAADDINDGLKALKAWAKTEKVGMKVALGSVRYAAVGLLSGIGMATLIAIMPLEELRARLRSLRADFSSSHTKK